VGVQLPHNSFFVGGKPTDGKFVRVTVDHIAMNWERGSGREKGYLEWLGGVLKERFEGRGWTLVYFLSSSFTLFLPLFNFYYSTCVNDKLILLAGNSTSQKAIGIIGVSRAWFLRRWGAKL
jgi:hypothetical protein